MSACEASLAQYVHELAALAIAGKANPVAVLEDLARVTKRAAEAKRNPSAPVFTRAQLAAAIREYRLSHWGRGGNGRTDEMRAPDPMRYPLTQLGTLVEVTYQTSKLGDPKGTFYTHDFTRPKPVLAYSSEGLVICGGSYRVTLRGIEG